MNRPSHACSKTSKYWSVSTATRLKTLEIRKQTSAQNKKISKRKADRPGNHEIANVRIDQRIRQSPTKKGRRKTIRDLTLKNKAEETNLRVNRATLQTKKTVAQDATEVGVDALRTKIRQVHKIVRNLTTLLRNSEKGPIARKMREYFVGTLH